MRMPPLKKAMVLLLAAVMLSAFTACKDDGPAEKTGKQIDKAVEETKKSVKKLFD